MAVTIKPEVDRMKHYKVKRKSHCNVCGKRLSEKRLMGHIHWQPCHIDDKGIYCVACAVPKGSARTRKNAPL